MEATFEMTLNLVVPVGAVRFVLYDDRDPEKRRITEVILSLENYQRLTVPPKIWVGFQGVSNGLSTIMNFADIPHQPEESERSIFPN